MSCIQIGHFLHGSMSIQYLDSVVGVGCVLRVSPLDTNVSIPVLNNEIQTWKDACLRTEVRVKYPHSAQLHTSVHCAACLPSILTTGKYVHQVCSVNHLLEHTTFEESGVSVFQVLIDWTRLIEIISSGQLGIYRKCWVGGASAAICQLLWTRCVRAHVT